MAIFLCSVIISNSRFVNRQKIVSVCMYGAYLKLVLRYKPLNRYNPLYLVEYCGKYRYYDIFGKEVK